jgi:glycosyltransferase involved in cell wall biosynthesis
VTALYRVSLRRADEVLFLNSDDLEDFVNWNVVLPERAYKLGAIGVNLDIWRMDPPPVMPTTFLFVARLLKEKGIVEFIEAARRVRAVNRNARFVVLGAPDRNPSSVGRSDVEHWTREGLIQWPGHTDVRPWMEQCSVFVLPSYREGVPRSTQEAAAAGRPIITTNVPGCRDTVINGVNGYLVPPKDPSALEEAMLRFLADPASILRMGRASRVLAEERFDVVQANRILMSFLLRKPELAQ